MYEIAVCGDVVIARYGSAFAMIPVNSWAMYESYYVFIAGAGAVACTTRQAIPRYGGLFKLLDLINKAAERNPEFGRGCYMVANLARKARRVLSGKRIIHRRPRRIPWGEEVIRHAGACIAALLRVYHDEVDRTAMTSICFDVLVNDVPLLPPGGGEGVRLPARMMGDALVATIRERDDDHNAARIAVCRCPYVLFVFEDPEARPPAEPHVSVLPHTVFEVFADNLLARARSLDNRLTLEDFVRFAADLIEVNAKCRIFIRSRNYEFPHLRDAWLAAKALKRYRDGGIERAVAWLERGYKISRAMLARR